MEIKGLHIDKMKENIALLMIFLVISLPAALCVEISPGSVSLTNLTDTSFAVSWKTDVPSKGYLDYGQRYGSMVSVTEEGIDKTSHSVVLSRLDPGTKYYYEVASEDDTGYDKEGPYDATTLLGKVKGLKKEDATYSQVILEWTPDSKADKYRIYRDNARIAETQSSYKHYTDAAVAPGRQYNYSVSAVDGLGREGIRSDSLVVAVPEEPVNISFVEAVDITKDSARIRWKTATSSNSTVMYDRDSTLDRIKSDPALTKSHDIMLSGLEPDTRYTYIVRSGSEESSRSTFKTFSEDAEIAISNMGVSDITKDSATVSWTTNMPSGSTVYYSPDDSFSQSDGMPGSVTSHSVVLDGLMSGMTYYYKVESDGVASPVSSFTTSEADGLENYLRISAMPSMTSSTRINVSGTSRLNSRIYIFVNNNQKAQVRQMINGTSFLFEVTLDASSTIDGVKGKNLVEVYSWDANGAKDIKSFRIILDTAAPLLEVDSLPYKTNRRSINITGKTEPNMTVEVFFDSSSKGAAIVNESGRFIKENFNLGSGDAEHEIKVVASDEIGNRAVFTQNITADFTNPKIEFESEIRGETHFKLIKIKGKTEPNSRVRAVNYGKYSGCDDAGFVNEFGISCQQFLSPSEHTPRITVNIDPIAWAFSETETTANDNGEFDVGLTMISGEGNAAQMNTIIFYVYDEAGNMGQAKKQIKYTPGCKDWIVGEDTESFPFNIYATDLRESSIPASAIINVNYIGTGTPKVSDVKVFDDKNNLGYFQQDSLWGEGQINNDMIDIGTPKASKFDPGTNKFVIYAPLTIRQNRDPVDKLPEEIRAYLGASITYEAEGNKNTCEIYIPIVFDMQKPELVTNWLSPEMINDTIKALDGAINITEKLVDYLKQITTWGMIACGVMVAWQYVSGFFSAAEDLTKTSSADGKSECSEKEKELEKVYYLCDRMLCPAAPPKCNDFNAVGESTYKVGGGSASKEEYEAQVNKNQPIENAFEEYKRSNNYNSACKMDDFVKKDSDKCSEADYPDNLGDYKAVSEAKPYRYSSGQIYDGSNNPVTMDIQYFPVDQRGKIERDYNNYLVSNAGQNIYIELENTFAKEAAACPGGTLVVTRITANDNSGNINNQMRPVKAAESIGEFKFECVRNKTPEQVGEPSVSGISSCYSSDCPKFDNTKCFDRANINPPAALYSSFVCGCFPGMKSYLEQYLTIMKSAKKCLQQAQIGETTGGYCERLLAQFICDIMIEIIRAVLTYLDDTETGSAEISGVDSRAKGVLGNYKENSAQVTSQLSGRYGGIINEKLGLSGEKLVNKACVVAITGDWSMIEGLVDQIADTVEIEPIINIEGESRPYSYDPFTGRMNIGYNIYIGVLPGGKTTIKAWLECDRDYPGGQYCGDSVDPMPIRGYYPLMMSKDDNPVDKNVFFVDPNTKWWYNKVRLTAEYEIGENRKVLEIEEEIKKKGDLAYGCQFSMMNGIKCTGPEFFGADGTIGFVNSKCSLSPQMGSSSNTYQIGNRVAALLYLETDYQNDFFIRVDYDDQKKEPIEYQYSSSGAEYGGTSAYLIWLDTIGDGSTTSSSNEQESPYIPKLNLGIKSKDAKVNAVLGNADSARITFSGTITAKKEDGSSYSSSLTSDMCVLSNGVEKECTLFDQAEIMNLRLNRGTIEFNINKIVVNTAEKVPSENNPSVTIKGLGNGGNDIVYNFEKKSAATSSSSSSTGAKKGTKATISLLGDTGNGGRTLIYYDGQPQTLEYTYYVGDGKNMPDKPVVQLVEPTGNYFPVADDIPLGFTIVNGNNEISEIKIFIRDLGRGSLEKTVVCRKDNNGYKCNDGLIEFDSGRSTFNTDNAPPFYAFKLKKGQMDVTAESIYRIDVSAKGRNEYSSPITRSGLKFVSDKEITVDRARVFLGSGSTQSWGGPSKATSPKPEAQKPDTPTASAGSDTG